MAVTNLFPVTSVASGQARGGAQTSSRCHRRRCCRSATSTCSACCGRFCRRWSRRDGARRAGSTVATIRDNQSERVAVWTREIRCRVVSGVDASPQRSPVRASLCACRGGGWSDSANCWNDQECCSAVWSATSAWLPNRAASARTSPAPASGTRKADVNGSAVASVHSGSPGGAATIRMPRNSARARL